MKEDFVCVAVNQHHHRRRKDLEYELFERLVEQTGEKVSGRNQGLYFFAPSGELLSFSNTLSGEQAWELVRQAEKKFRPPTALPAILEGHEDAGPLWQLPDGGRLVLVSSKVLSGYDEAGDPRAKIPQQSLGRDHFYLSSGEIAELISGSFPEALKRRLPALLNDNTRGEPGRWRSDEIRNFDIALAGGRLTGSLHFEEASGDRGYVAKMLGFVAGEEDELTRFDLVVSGSYWGEGRYTRGGPSDRFPFAVAFRLSDGSEPYDTPPPGVR